MTSRRVRTTGRRTSAITGLVLAAIAGGGVEGAASTGGLKLVVAQGIHEVEVTVAARATRIRPEWGPPVLAGPGAPAGFRELLVAFFDRGGRPVGAFGFPAVGAEAMELGTVGDEGDEELLAGRISFPATTERVLEVPLPRGAAYLVIALARRLAPGETPTPSVAPEDRSCLGRVAVSGGTTLELTAFRVYALGEAFGGPRRSARRHAVGLAPAFSGFPRLQINPTPVCPIPQIPAGLLSCPFLNGYYHSQATLLAASGGGSPFDIVILGDGFREMDFPKLDHYAGLVAARLPATPPFDEFAGHFNVSLVRTVSPDSGVTNCPVDQSRQTYYEVTGKWTDEYGEGPPGFLGTSATCKLLRDVNRVIPWEEAELIVMIANCDVYGGRALFGDSLFFMPTIHDSEDADPYADFEKIAVHEAAHVVAWLGEEYVACAEPNGAYPFPDYFPNVAPGPASSSVWWRSLLLPAEQTAQGDFRAVHRCGDPWQNAGPPPCGPVVNPPANAEMLGLYWGAMYGEPAGSPNQCSVLCQDPSNPDGPVVGTASCDYFRPQARCRMRGPSSPFCRACASKLREAIQAAVAP